MAPGETTSARLRLGVLFSGTGRTLENLVLCCRQGSCPAEVVLAISSRPGAAGIARAESLRVPLEVVDVAVGEEAFQERIHVALLDARVDLVLLAGFLRPFRIDEHFRGRVMNIHPSLLPAYGGSGFYGPKVHRAVLASGDRQSGCTVHFASELYDGGPIILQRVVPVLTGDTEETLAKRVFSEECKAYPEAVRLYAEGRLVTHGARVRIL